MLYWGFVRCGFYKTTFIAGLRLPLTSLHHRLTAYMGVSVCQIAPNAWRIFIVAEVLWGQLSGGHQSLTLEDFFHCYKPQEIPDPRVSTILCVVGLP